MKILVLAKQVPDTWQERELSLETGWVVRDGAAEPVPDEISERVMEVALGWRDAGADIEVVALTVGPEDSSKTLRKMLAMGADSAVQITDDALVGSDAVQTARVIAAAVEKEGADLVLAGTLSTDGGTGVVPASGSSSSAMPFLKLLMPLATSPIRSEKRPLPNSRRTTTPTSSQCQRLKPPITRLPESRYPT